MSKLALLHYLAEIGHADAHEVAAAHDLHYAATAMALLRLTRQGLVDRYLDPDLGVYWYTLSERGRQRLAYFKAFNASDIEGERYAP